MAVVVDIVRLAARADAGTQDFTVSGSETCKAALFFISGATANDTLTNNAILGMGMCDATSQYGMGAISEHNISPTNTRRFIASNACIRLNTVTGVVTTVDGYAAFSSFINSGGVWGVRVNWVDALSAQFLVTCVLFGGSDLSVKVSHFVSSTFDVPVSITTPAFVVDQVITMTTQSVIASSGTAGILDFGFAGRNAGLTLNNRSMNIYNSHAGETAVDFCLMGGSVVSRRANSESGPAMEFTFPASPTQGFIATPRSSTNAVGYPYLALGYNNAVSHDVRQILSPFTAGNVLYTVDFKPQFVMHALGSCPTQNTSRSGSESLSSRGAGVMGACVHVPGKMYMHSLHDNDAANPSVSKSFADTKLKLIADNGTTLCVVDSSAFTATGYTLSTTQSTLVASRLWPTLVIGEFSGGGPQTHLAQATLSCSFTITSLSNCIYPMQQSLASAFAIAAPAVAVRQAKAPLTSAFSVTPTPVVIRNAQANLAMQFALTPLASTIIQVSASLSSSFSMTADSLMTHNAETALLAESSVGANAVLIQTAYALMTSEFGIAEAATAIHQASSVLTFGFSLTSIPQLTQAAYAALASDFGVSAAATRNEGGVIHEAQAILLCQFDVVPQAVEIHLAQSALASVFTVAPTSLLTLGASAALFSNFIVTSLGMAERGATSTMTSQFSVASGSAVIRNVQAALTSAWNFSSDATVIHQAASSLASEFTITTVGMMVLNAYAILTDEFGVTTAATMVQAAQCDLASVFSIVPTAAAAYTTQANLAAQFAIVAAATKPGDLPGTWHSIGTPRRYIVADNVGLSFGMEAYMRATQGRVNARLYNVTDSLPVIGSDVFTEAPPTDFTIVRTPILALTNGKEYVSQFALNATGTNSGEVRGSSMVIL